jgi:hypothetical protein
MMDFAEWVGLLGLAALSVAGAVIWAGIFTKREIATTPPWSPSSPLSAAFLKSRDDAMQASEIERWRADALMWKDRYEAEWQAHEATIAHYEATLSLYR